MYLYFDINGNLKEIVQVPVREGSIKHNIIYIYVEKSGEPVDNVYHLSALYTNGKINFKLVDSDVSLNVNLLPMTKVSDVQLPQNNQRDLYFFKYGYKYEMWSIELPASVNSVNGVVSASAYLYNESTQFALDTFSFNVQASVGMTMDSTITESQYTYLYEQLKQYNVPGSQMTFTIIRDTLTNLNGRELTNYESELVTLGEAPNQYQAYKITYGDEKLTEDLASRYMEYMTGSSFLPKYNYQVPKNSLFMLTNGLVLKPQYDDTNGLLLFVMGAPFASKISVEQDAELDYKYVIKLLNTNNTILSSANLIIEKAEKTSFSDEFNTWISGYLETPVTYHIILKDGDNHIDFGIVHLVNAITTYKSVKTASNEYMATFLGGLPTMLKDGNLIINPTIYYKKII